MRRIFSLRSRLAIYATFTVVLGVYGVSHAALPAAAGGLIDPSQVAGSTFNLNPSGAQLPGTDALLSGITANLAVVQKSMIGYASNLFLLLVGLDVFWMVAQFLLTRDNLGEFLAQMTTKVFTVSFIYYVLVLHGADLSTTIIGSFTQAATNATSASSNYDTDTGPLSLVGQGAGWAAIPIAEAVGVDLIPDEILGNGATNLSKAASEMLTGAAFAIFGVFAGIAAEVAIATLEVYVVLNLGIIVTGFLGSRWTERYGQGFLSFAIHSGLRFMFLQIMLGMIHYYIDNVAGPFNAIPVVGPAIFAAYVLVAAALLHAIPGFAASALSGTSNASGAQLASAMSQVFGGVAQGIKAAANLPKQNAASAQARSDTQYARDQREDFYQSRSASRGADTSMMGGENASQRQGSFGSGVTIGAQRAASGSSSSNGGNGSTSGASGNGAGWSRAVPAGMNGVKPAGNASGAGSSAANTANGGASKAIAANGVSNGASINGQRARASIQSGANGTALPSTAGGSGPALGNGTKPAGAQAPPAAPKTAFSPAPGAPAAKALSTDGGHAARLRSVSLPSSSGSGGSAGSSASGGPRSSGASPDPSRSAYSGDGPGSAPAGGAAPGGAFAPPRLEDALTTPDSAIGLPLPGLGVPDPVIAPLNAPGRSASDGDFGGGDSGDSGMTISPSVAGGAPAPPGARPVSTGGAPSAAGAAPSTATSPSATPFAAPRAAIDPPMPNASTATPFTAGSTGIGAVAGGSGSRPSSGGPAARQTGTPGAAPSPPTQQTAQPSPVGAAPPTAGTRQANAVPRSISASPPPAQAPSNPADSQPARVARTVAPSPASGTPSKLGSPPQAGSVAPGSAEPARPQSKPQARPPLPLPPRPGAVSPRKDA